MSKDLYKVRRAKSSPGYHDADDLEVQPKVKRKKGSGNAGIWNLLKFCDVVLNYEGYPNAHHEELRKKAGSPLDSNGSTADSFSSESTLSCSTPEMDDSTSSDYRSRHKLQKQSPPHSSTLSPGKENKSSYDFSGGLHQGKQSPSSSPTSSTSSSPPSPMSKIASESIITNPEDEDDETITCFCRKPYGGRPMIQCEQCLTWIHYSCAKIRKNKVPEKFFCHECKKARNTKPVRFSLYENQLASPSSIVR